MSPEVYISPMVEGREAGVSYELDVVSDALGGREYGCSKTNGASDSPEDIHGER